MKIPIPEAVAVPSSEQKKDSSRMVVRLARSYWMDDRGLHNKTSLLFLKSKSFGWQVLREDVADDAMRSIVNLGECQDGVYEVVAFNVSVDWESGDILEVGYRLVPFEDSI